MLVHPIKAPTIYIWPLAPDAALVGSGLDYRVLQGTDSLRILKLLDGRSLESVCVVVQGELSIPEVMHAIFQLIDLGLVVESSFEEPALDVARALPATDKTHLPALASRNNPWRCDSVEGSLQHLAAAASQREELIVHLQSVKTPSAAPFYAYRAGLYSRSVKSPRGVHKRIPEAAASGKGATKSQAKLSALAEALERYSGIYRPGDDSAYGSPAQFAGQAIHPADLMGFSPAQVADRDSSNREASVLHWVPPALSVDQEIGWSKAWSLTLHRERLIPTGWAFYNTPTSLGSAYSVACSNGTAAGSNLDEAIFHGTLELVERDAVGIWWYNQIVRTQVDLAAIDHEFLRQTYAYVKALGRDLWVLNLTHDLGVPVFAALSRVSGTELDGFILGFGAHVDPLEAVLKAIAEITQMLAEAPAGPLAKPWPGAVPRPASEILAFLLPQPSQQSVPLRRDESDCSSVQTANALMQKRMVDLGLEVLVIDQTRAETGLVVAKVIVPGLRHFWRRLGPGRFYQVPLTLGWRREACRESDLNPWDLYV